MTYGLLRVGSRDGRCPGRVYFRNIWFRGCLLRQQEPDFTYLVTGVILFLLVLAVFRRLPLKLPVLIPKAGKARSPGQAYVIGIPFGLMACPTCTPLILPVAAGILAAGSPWYGMGMLAMAFFGLGQGVPLLLPAGGAGRLRALPAWEGISAW